jgi:hypothetical protein
MSKKNLFLDQRPNSKQRPCCNCRVQCRPMTWYLVQLGRLSYVLYTLRSRPAQQTRNQHFVRVWQLDIGCIGGHGICYLSSIYTISLIQTVGTRMQAAWRHEQYYSEYSQIRSTPLYLWYDMIWYMIGYDMIYDMIWYMMWYDMIYNITWYIYDMIWCNMIWYDMIWCLNVIGLTPGGNSTVDKSVGLK